MAKLEGCVNHQCCPKDWKEVPNITGSHELDAVIARSTNSDVNDRLKMYVDRQAGAYAPRTAYNGYSNYNGDS